VYAIGECTPLESNKSQYLLWGRRRNGRTDHFTLAVYMQFLIVADTSPSGVMSAPC